MTLLSSHLVVPLWKAVPLVVAGVLALAWDLKTRRIPNRLTGTLALLGLIAQCADEGPRALPGAFLGMAMAGALLLPGWVMGWTGGGDVKLVAAMGAWLGFPHCLAAALAALIAGGVIALIVAVQRRMLARSLWSAAVLGSWAMSRAPGSAPPPVTTGVRFPFAGAVLAIARRDVDPGLA